MRRILLTALAAAVPLQSFAADLTKVQTGPITELVGQLLERMHYRRSSLNDTISQTFLKNYLNALDYNHLIFLQSDIEGFETKYGSTLDDRTQNGDPTAAYDIFNKYLERLTQRREMVELLVKQQHDFTKDESFNPVRNKAPWPKDDAEAQELWRLRIKYEILQSRLAKENQDEVADKISRRYSRLEKTMRSFGTEEILQTYLTALSNAYDPHSDYFSPAEAKNFDIQHISLSLSGIGATLEWDDGYTKVKSLVPGGPADLSKQIRPGDKIVGVAQGPEEPVDTIEMRLNKVVEMIRGKRGTEVRLTVIPAKAPDTKKVVTIIRDEIKLQEQYAKARVLDQPDSNGTVHRYGVITLPQFYDDCAAHVEKLLERLKKEKVEGVVLDLRRNGGGILEEAIKLTGLFIRKGPVVQVKDSRKQIQVMKDDNGKVAYDGPLIVMVSRLSASASEIVAAALQDYERAVIVGDQATHGKGTVQTVLSLDPFLRASPLEIENPGKLKLTVSKFYRVEGGTTQKEGVTPDIVFPSVWDHMEIGESAMENALPSDRITAVSHERLGKADAYTEQLNTRSKARIKNDRDFAYLAEDIEMVKKNQADRTVSLNEAKRLKEKEEQEAKIEARKKERAARQLNGEKAFELTLKMVDENLPMEPLIAKVKEDPAVPVPATDPDAAPEEEEEDDSQIDGVLRESVHILSDYKELLENPNSQRLANTAAK